MGQRVIEKLVQLIENELNSIGCQKMCLSILGSKQLWLKAGRWDRMSSEIFHLQDRQGKYFCLQPTAEEMFAQIVAQRGIFVFSVPNNFLIGINMRLLFFFFVLADSTYILIKSNILNIYFLFV